MTKSVFTKDYNYFRNLLINARKNIGITQIDLANKLSKPQSFISKYESGERRLDVVEFLEISKALEIDPLKIIKQLLNTNNENNSH